MTGEMTKEEAILEIKEKTPKLLEEYRALAEAIAKELGLALPGTEAEDDDREEIDIDELHELYEAILEFAEGYDLDSVDRLLKQAKEYRIPEAESERFAKLTDCVRNSDWDGLKEVLQ